MNLQCFCEWTNKSGPGLWLWAGHWSSQQLLQSTGSYQLGIRDGQGGQHTDRVRQQNGFGQTFFQFLALSCICLCLKNPDISWVYSRTPTSHSEHLVTNGVHKQYVFENVSLRWLITKSFFINKYDQTFYNQTTQDFFLKKKKMWLLNYLHLQKTGFWIDIK